MVHGITHGLTDATASLQLATILRDTDANLSYQANKTSIQLLFPATASRTGRLGVLLPARIMMSSS